MVASHASFAGSRYDSAANRATSPFMSRYDYRECGRDRSGANLYRFGAFNPAGAAKQGVYMINSMGAAAGGEGDAGQVDLGLFGSVNVEPRGSKWYRSQVTAAQLDRSLSETAPGTYTTNIKLRRSGHFDVPVLIDQPRLHKCFQLDIGPSPEGEDERGLPIAVEAMFKDGPVKAGETISLKFKIVDSVTKKPLKGLGDVTVLVFQQPGIWQQRQMARETRAGVYEITQVFPNSGLFNVILGVHSRGVAFADLPFNTVKVF